MTFKVSHVSPVIIPSDVPLSRRAPRPLDKRQDHYVERFDYKTIFYDIYRSGDQVIFSGPPLLNFDSLVRVAKISLFGKERIDTPKLETLWKTQRSSIQLNPLEAHGAASDGFEFEVGRLKSGGRVQPDENGIFKGLKVLFTMSKNNNLEWIKDWATFYHKIHGVNAVLIYDNGSTDYTTDELVAVLRSIEGIEAAVVVDWPFKYGPGGINAQTWDSDYCQYSAIEHARRRFLKYCQGVVSVDIDELVVTDDERSVFDHLSASKSGALLFEGRWIENVTDVVGRLPKFTDYQYFDVNVAPATRKWVLDPMRVPEQYQWNVHSFAKGFIPDHPVGVSHRHFVGINSNWKKDRTTKIVFEADRHVSDIVLTSALARAFD